MSHESRAWSWFIALTVAAAPTFAQSAADDEGIFEPGVRHVCVPAADGDGWDCGTESEPPKNMPESQGEPAPAAEETPASDTTEVASMAAEASESESPPPPPFLADPARDTPYAPVDSSDAPAVVDAAAEPTETQVDATPVAELAPAALVDPPVAASDAADAGMNAPADAPTAPTPAAVTPEPVAAPAPVARAAYANSRLGGASEFAQLPATAFTLQLAYAADSSGFAQLVGSLGLDPATCYALRVRGPGGSTWLLAHGAFVDVATARAAQATLPRVAGLSAQWPRRIGALQTELAAQGR